MLTNVTVTVTEIAKDHYELHTSAPNPFRADESSGITRRVEVVEGTLWGLPAFRVLDRVSHNRIFIVSHDINQDVVKLVVLDRQNIPPKKPKLLSAVVSGKDVILDWTDNSDDESGFNILRRDKLSGVYSNVDTTPADETQYTNTVPLSGFYWYRITATNMNGSSIGSNVKRVVVP